VEVATDDLFIRIMISLNRIIIYSTRPLRLAVSGSTFLETPLRSMILDIPAPYVPQLRC
jgi:hypothetical protein